MPPIRRLHDSDLSITDIFCGCGGSSTGALLAHSGVRVRMAINHWKLAVETHNTNHPETDHDCCDISTRPRPRRARTQKTDKTSISRFRFVNCVIAALCT